MPATTAVGRQVAEIVAERPDDLVNHVMWLRFARNRRLDGQTDDKTAAHELSCAAGELLRFLGIYAWDGVRP